MNWRASSNRFAGGQLAKWMTFAVGTSSRKFGIQYWVLNKPVQGFKPSTVRVVRARYDAAGVTPAANLVEFKRQVSFQGIVPSTTTGPSFGVLLEPLKNNFIGTAAVAGCVLTRVLVGSIAYTCAETVDGQNGYLRSVPHGPASVLWIETTGAVRWAVIRFDDGYCQISTDLAQVPVPIAQDACAACILQSNPRSKNSVTCSKAIQYRTLVGMLPTPELLDCVKPPSSGVGTELETLIEKTRSFLRRVWLGWLIPPRVQCGCSTTRRLMNQHPAV
jgi:hypothetical protein